MLKNDAFIAKEKPMLCGSQANLTMFMICWYVGPTQNEKWKYKERCSSLIRNLYPASPVPTHESATYRFVIHSIYRDLNEADIPVRCVPFFFLPLRFAFGQGHSTREGKITSKNRQERKSNVSTSAWLLRTCHKRCLIVVRMTVAIFQIKVKKESNEFWKKKLSH